MLKNKKKWIVETKMIEKDVLMREHEDNIITHLIRTSQDGKYISRRMKIMTNSNQLNEI